jgi:Tol biopolymer transport system component
MNSNRTGLIILMLAVLCLSTFGTGHTPTVRANGGSSTRLISIADDGSLPTGYPSTYASAWQAGMPSISDDGNTIAFSTNIGLVPEDMNGLTDVYIYDVVNDRHILASPTYSNNRAAGVDTVAPMIHVSLSGDGSRVAFASKTDTLVPNDTNGKADIFIFDRDTGIVSRVMSQTGAELDGGASLPDLSFDGTRVVFSSNSNIYVADSWFGTGWRVLDKITRGEGGADPDGPSGHPAINNDGDAVTFVSKATNLRGDDSSDQGKYDIFFARLDPDDGIQLFRVTSGNGDSFKPDIVGYRVIFKSSASDLVADDTNGKWDIFVWTWMSSPVTLVSRGYDGSPSDGHSGGAMQLNSGPVWSADSKYIAFASSATNLVWGDTNNASDIFVYELRSATTTRVSITSTGAQTDGDSFGSPAVSSYPLQVAFYSRAGNLSAMSFIADLDLFLYTAGRTASPPTVTIDMVDPSDVTLGQGGYVRLRGSVTHALFPEAPENAIRGFAWYSSIDGLISQQQNVDVPIERFSPGTHFITLHAVDVDHDSGVSPVQQLVVHPQGSAIETLILTNYERLYELYPASKAPLAAKVEALAAHPQVNGMILAVDSDPAVRTAYTNWRNENTTTRANQVSSAIKALVDRTWQSLPDLQYLVIVGDDRVIPFRRVDDLLTTYPTESDYITLIGGDPVAAAQTTIGRALADNQILTDDYYGYNRTAYQARGLPEPVYPIPDLGTGRLIEDPTQIVLQIDAFLSQATVPIDRALVSAFATGLVEKSDGSTEEVETLSDSGQQQCRDLVHDGIASDCGLPGWDLIGWDWTADSFRESALAGGTHHDLIAFHHHAAHFLFGEPPRGYVYANEIKDAPSDITRSILVTAGCHAGLNVGPDYPTGALDLPQAATSQQSNYLGNTGYGIGGVYTVSWSEELLSIFNRNLINGSVATPGLALSKTKSEYLQTSYQYSSLGWTEEFSNAMKSSLQLTLYGLPMYRYTTPGGTTLAATEPFDAVQVQQRLTTMNSGLTVNSLSYQFPPFSKVTTPGGDYYTLNGEAQASHGRPVQPRYSTDVDFPATRAHGVVLRGGSYTDLTEFDPLVAMAVNQYVSAEEPALSGSAWSPSLLGRLNSLIDQETLVALLGQYQPSSQTERIYQELDLAIYYHPNTSDWIGPQINTQWAVRSSTTATINVRANDSAGIAAVIVAYTDGSGAWASVELSRGADDVWFGTFPASATTTYMIQVVDGFGNVAVGDNQGRYYLPTPVGQAPFHLYMPVVLR